jgi:hypothetical protein
MQASVVATRKGQRPVVFALAREVGLKSLKAAQVWGVGEGAAACRQIEKIMTRPPRL